MSQAREKQFLKSNGIAEVSGMVEEHLTVGRCSELEIILSFDKR